MVIGILAIILSVVLFCAFFGGAGIIALILAVIMLIAGISLLAKNFTLGFDSNLEKTVAQFGCIHLSGLPLGEVACQVTAYENRLVFKKDKSTYELSYDKITAVDLREKSQLAGASAGSVVAGAVLFGALGAVIAARPKNKKEYIFVISYLSDGETKTIAAAVPYENGYIADRAVAVIKKNITAVQNVVL